MTWSSSTVCQPCGAPRRVPPGVWGFLSMESLRQDVRYAFRLIKRSPGFTAVAALAIALGIGPTTTILSVANASLLRTPAGVLEPATLVTIHASQVATATFETFSYPVFERYREAPNGLSRVAAIDPFPASLAAEGTGEPKLVSGVLASADYFATLGTQPALGRLFQAGEDRTPSCRCRLGQLCAGAARRANGSDAGASIGVRKRLHGWGATLAVT